MNKILKMIPARYINLIRECLPYGYIMSRKERHNDFIKLLTEYQNGPKKVIPVENSKYSNVISVQGFGYSGSGAVLDLLREYPIKVIGFVDVKEGSKTSAKETSYEIEILRLAGGFFEIEKYLGSDNVFLNTALLNRTVKILQHSALYRYSQEMRELFVEFFDSLLDLKLLNLSQTYYNPFLTGLENKSSVFYLKNMTVSEFRTKARNLLNVIFNRIDTTHKFLAVDQLIADIENNIERNTEYIPNLKTILVVRDPRDLYVWSKIKNVEWIAHDTLEDFIKYYKIYYKNVDFSKDSSQYCIVRYESLIKEYEKTVSKVQEYLGLKDSDHIHKLESFDPAISKKYIELYKQHPEFSADCEVIERELSYHCNPVID